MNYEVSIIIPTVNPKNYLYDCLKSVKEQDFDEKNYEIIVILNAKKNDGYNVIINFITELNVKNYRVIYTDILGVSNARNIGIINAKSKYVTFLDDDDYISTNFLSALLKEIEDKQSVIAFAKTLCFENDKFYDDYINKSFDKIDSRSAGVYESRALYSNSTKALIPLSLIGVSRFNTTFKNHEDALFMATISNRVDHSVLCYNAFYYRRINQYSASRIVTSTSEEVSKYLKYHKEILKLFFKKGYNKKFLTRVLLSNSLRIFRVLIKKEK